MALATEKELIREWARRNSGEFKWVPPFHGTDKIARYRIFLGKWWMSPLQPPGNSSAGSSGSAGGANLAGNNNSIIYQNQPVGGQSGQGSGQFAEALILSGPALRNLAVQTETEYETGGLPPETGAFALGALITLDDAMGGKISEIPQTIHDFPQTSYNLFVEHGDQIAGETITGIIDGVLGIHDRVSSLPKWQQNASSGPPLESGAGLGLQPELIHDIPASSVDAGLQLQTSAAGNGGASRPPTNMATGALPFPGSSGGYGENLLKLEFGGRPQYFNTSLGPRIVDQITNGIAREAKTGYQALTPDIKSQIAKDSELLISKQVQSVEWHFYTSPVTGENGPSGPLLQALQTAHIDVIKHP